jgi:hypothetical protein
VLALTAMGCPTFSMTEAGPPVSTTEDEEQHNVDAV